MASKYGFSSDDDRIKGVSAYAKSQGLYVNSLQKGKWWLRSPNNNLYDFDYYAYCVYYGGSIYGSSVYCTGSGIRAACWINL